MFLAYNYRDSMQLKMHDFYLINGDGEVPELMGVFKELKSTQNDNREFRLKEPIVNFAEWPKINVTKLFQRYNVSNIEDLFIKKLSQSHCSAFIKLLKNDQSEITDVLFTHSTWDDYSEMLRIYKYYDFELNGKGAIHGLNQFEISFSSYPGCMVSTDDWYIIDKNLAVMETTIDILNENLFQFILMGTLSLPDYMRIMLTNRLATSAENWVFWMEYINTGTYNSQWMVLDLLKISQAVSEKKKTLLDNSFIVLEQMPGQMNFQWADLSSKLVEDNYWASYNVPYFDQIRKLSGFSDMEEQKGGQSYSWKSSPRAVIFKAHARNVNCVEDLKKLMQLNPYYKGIENNSQDPDNPTYSNPAYCIAAREDLKKNVGAIDTKIANLDMVRNKKTLAISGPTYQNQEPFVWSLSKKNDPHEGLPDKWMFPWVELNFNNEH